MVDYRRVLVQTIHAISAVEAHHDPYTARHQRSVGELSYAIGRELGLESDRLEGLYLGALLHDIGKVALPEAILRKPARLTPDEYALVKTHVQAGCNILAKVAFPWPIHTIVAQHHERLDGSGYPQGLAGEGICLEARIVAVADVFDAMSERRPYRQVSGIRVALEELDRSAGTTLDRDAVDVLRTIVAGKGGEAMVLARERRLEPVDAEFAEDYLACLGG